MKASLIKAQPDFVFHLAAQPLVRLSYREPLETWNTNVMGTIHVLEALRGLDKECTAIMVTTDKCYENREWLHSYREEDALGGHDPYSSSKAGCELAIASWRRSFFSPQPLNSSSPQPPLNSSPSDVSAFHFPPSAFSQPSVLIASARAGNVIGGGDWAQDRIVPDCIRALENGEAIPVRNKAATRPWQHVLEPLGGYLLLASKVAALSDQTINEERRTNNEERETLGSLLGIQLRPRFGLEPHGRRHCSGNPQTLARRVAGQVGPLRAPRGRKIEPRHRQSLPSPRMATEVGLPDHHRKDRRLVSGGGKLPVF